MKSLKSKIEINNTIDSHITDTALTKFLIWLKKIIKKKSKQISAQKNY